MRGLLNGRFLFASLPPRRSVHDERESDLVLNTI
jgi:hypothetical protein